jgi:Carboxylesterase family
VGSIQKTTLWFVVVVGAAVGMAQAQVPPEIAKQLITIGRGVCVPETAYLYRPLHPNPPYPGVTIVRDISFGPDPKDVLDVFSPEKGGGKRPVLIYVSGGAGNKLQGGPNGDVFYDNVMLWAVKNGMVGVNMQRHPGQEWDGPAKDVGMVVQWVNQNIAGHKGNPARVFIWTQSAGNIPVSTYIGHSELYSPKGVGVKGVVFMSPPAFNILPATPPPVQGGGGGGFGQCGQPSGYTPAAPPAGADGRGRGRGGRDGRGPGGPGGPGRAQVDPATQLARSNLPGLVSSKLPFLVVVAELDPPNIIGFAETLKAELCKAGRCPTYLTFKDHSHISEVMSPNTPDTSVTGPILKWIKSVK